MDTASLIWVDVNGNQTITRINSLVGLSAFKSAMLACSTGDWSQQWSSLLLTNTPAPAGGQYSSAADRAVLLYLCADSTLARLIIPAPSLSIFMADGETVDPSSAAIVALNAALIGQLVASSGSATVSYVSGYRLPRAQAPMP